MKELNELSFPEDVRYAESHEWVKITGETAKIGITDYAQDQLGDIVFVELPDVGESFDKGSEFGTVESVKAVSELYMPVGGEIVAINEGLEDAPEWFGQRDPMEDETAGPEFPIAFRPQDVVNSGNAPKIVFTEACYGANTVGKTKDTALSLKFLASGTRTVVGSTKISYGSITTPLIAADLLGRLYWEQLAQALPVGEALRRAKLNLAAEMHRRHGFLDAEDQKTLISFVLFGDPLFSPTYAAPRYGQKVIIRRKTRPKHMKTVCTSKDADDHTFNLADLARVKSIVSQYLPGMADANCRMHRQQYYGCDGEGHICPTHTLSMQKIARLRKDTTVVTFSKHVEAANRRHPHFARITLDETGKVLKLTVSR